MNPTSVLGSALSYLTLMEHEMMKGFKSILVDFTSVPLCDFHQRLEETYNMLKGCSQPMLQALNLGTVVLTLT